MRTVETLFILVLAGLYATPLVLTVAYFVEGLLR